MSLLAPSLILLLGCPAPSSNDREWTPPNPDAFSNVLTDSTSTYGRTVHSYEMLRVLYRFGYSDYGDEGMDVFDRFMETGAANSGLERDLVVDFFEEDVLPYEQEIRRAFHPNVVDASFNASTDEVYVLMNRENPFSECPTGSERDDDEECREEAGPVRDIKELDFRPLLHSGYNHVIRDTLVLPTEGLGGGGDELKVPCTDASDCAAFGDGGLTTTCAVDSPTYEWTEGDMESIGGEAGYCQFGPQWDAGTRLALQLEGLFDTDAQLVLLQIEDGEGVETGAEDVYILSTGQTIITKVGGGEFPDDSVLFTLEDTYTFGDTALEYLDLTEQKFFYHPDEDYTNGANGLVTYWSDMLYADLPADLPAGLYLVKVEYDPGVVLDQVSDDTAEFWLQQGFLPDTPTAYTNGILIRVTGSTINPIEYYAGIERAKIVEQQETADEEPQVQGLIFKVDFNELGINLGEEATLDESMAKLESIYESYEQTGTVPGMLKLVHDDTGPLEDLDEGDIFDIGFGGTAFLSPNTGLVVHSVTWEYDGGEVPKLDLVNDLEMLLVSITKLAVNYYGEKAVFEGAVEYCGSNPAICGGTVGVYLAWKIGEYVYDYLKDPEFLGNSHAYYPFEELRIMTHGEQMGLTVDTAQAIYDANPGSSNPFPSLIPNSEAATFGEDNVKWSDTPRMDGQEAKGMEVNGGFKQAEYHEFRMLDAHGDTPWYTWDDDSLYVIQNTFRQY